MQTQQKRNEETKSKQAKIKSQMFGERPSKGNLPYNASEVVAIADSRFLFCDNNISDALFELKLAEDGSMDEPLIRRPIAGVDKHTVDDLEALALVEEGNRRYIFASPSMSLK